MSEYFKRVKDSYGELTPMRHLLNAIQVASEVLEHITILRNGLSSLEHRVSVIERALTAADDGDSA